MKNDNYNLEYVNFENLIGVFEMPTIEPVDYVPNKLTGFNYAMSSKDADTGIHFFLDDYQFERVWNRLHFYTDILKRFDCVFTPDFSLYTDMPVAQMIYNVYRSRLVGQYMQKQGLKVIPTASWADPVSYQFCFDGLPKHAAVAVSTVGALKNKDARKIWEDGFTELLERVEPNRILLYGGEIDYSFPDDLEIIRYPSNMRERFNKLEDKRRGR